MRQSSSRQEPLPAYLPESYSVAETTIARGHKPFARSAPEDYSL